MDRVRVWWGEVVHGPLAGRLTNLTSRILKRNTASAQSCRHCPSPYHPSWLNPVKHALRMVKKLPCVFPQVTKLIIDLRSQRTTTPKMKCSAVAPNLSHSIKLDPPQIIDCGNIIDSLEIYKNNLIRWVDSLQKVTILLTSLGSNISINEKEMFIQGMPLKIFDYLSLKSQKENLTFTDDTSSSYTNLALIFPQLRHDELDVFTSSSSSLISTSSFCSI